jgi:crotonobetainyl-CoA:carnitine CoA-transferase CaiB-like acyl-CoA transferase
LPTNRSFGDAHGMGQRRRPLASTRVVDLSQFLPGPMLSMMMADQGADVVRVEPPSGEPSRRMGPFLASGESVWFRQTNRGKSSVVLDLKTDDGKAGLWSLIDEADVLIESFRPGVADRLGFGRGAVHARRPSIVYCSISAFGQTGPASHHPAHDLGVQAMAGFLAVNDGTDGRPVVPGVAAADMAASLTALSAVVMALYERASTGEGAYIDVAMLDSLLPWCAHTAGSALVDGTPPRSAAQRSLGGAAFYDVYETADGKYVVLCGREAKFVHNLLTAFGRPDLIAAGDFEEHPDQTELKSFLREQFRTRSRDEWTDWFEHHDVAFAPVLDFAEAVRSEVVAARGLVVEHDDGSIEIGPSIRIDQPATGRNFQK